MDIVLILKIIFVFAALMFIHELGHFLFAKRAGIFVREFSLGLGPKLFSFKKGETQYSLRILPFGAYVRMAGEDPEVIEIKNGQTLGIKVNGNNKITDIYFDDLSRADQTVTVINYDIEKELWMNATAYDEQHVTFSISRDAVMHYDKKEIQIAPWDRQFGSKKIIDRFATVIAGPVFNILLTIILMFVVTNMVGVFDYIKLGTVNSETPAQEAGLQEGDVILAVNNHKIESNAGLIEQIQKSPGKEITLSIERDGNEMTVPVTPENIDGKGLIGVQLINVNREATVMEAASAAVKNTAQMTTLILDGFRQIFTGNVGMDDLAGPVGIMKITSEAASRGFLYLLEWSAILSLYLGIFNLLPVPALDGSRLLFITIEGVRGKPIDPQKESMVHLVGFAFLMLLMIVVTVNDVSRLFK